MRPSPSRPNSRAHTVPLATPTPPAATPSTAYAAYAAASVGTSSTSTPVSSSALSTASAVRVEMRSSSHPAPSTPMTAVAPITPTATPAATKPMPRSPRIDTAWNVRAVAISGGAASTSRMRAAAADGRSGQRPRVVRVAAGNVLTVAIAGSGACGAPGTGATTSGADALGAARTRRPSGTIAASTTAPSTR